VQYQVRNKMQLQTSKWLTSKTGRCTMKAQKVTRPCEKWTNYLK